MLSRTPVFSIGSLLLLGACITVFSSVPAAPDVVTKPNLIIILTDDQGYGDVGFNGCKDISTPNLDSIAHNGVQFLNGYVSYSVCSPSRAGLLTGRYEQRFGHERNPRWEPANPKCGLPLTETTMADALKKAGYHTGAIGKWHLGAEASFHPLKRGFDEFFGFLGGGHRYFPQELTLANPFAAKNEVESYRLKILRNDSPVQTTQYLTDEFSDEAVSFVDRNKDKPFFLYLAYNAPHAPLEAPPKYLQRFPNIQDPRRRTYAAMVSAVDDGVGRVLEKVKALGLDDKTLVFYLSDNGGPIQANASNNGPLRGAKGSPWEGGIHVPFAAQWPGHLTAGKTFAPPVISLDIFATISALANAPANPAHPLDGVNLMPYLTGEKSGDPHEAIYLRMYDKGAFAVRGDDFKEVIPMRDSAPQLFDLAEDIGEKTNIADAHPDQLKRLENLRVEWNAQLIAPIFEGLKEPKREKPGQDTSEND